MRRSLRSMVAASAVAAGTILGAMGLTAPTAGAMPARETQSSCRNGGGTFGTNYYYADGYRYFISHYCTYVRGDTRWTDFYDENYSYYMTCEGGRHTRATADNCSY